MVRRLVVVTLALGLAGGCNAIAWKRGQHETTFRRAGMVQHTARLGDARVRYWVGGADGPPVLLIHGFGASAIWQWFGQIEALAARHRVIVPDLLWFGDSASIKREVTIDDQVAMLVALLDKLDVPSVAAAGISYGGFVAYELAAAHPTRVRRLAILDSPARAYRREDYTALCQRFGVDHIGKVLVPSDEDGVARLMALAKYDPDWAPGWAKRQALEQLYGAHRGEQLALLNAMLADADDLQARRTRPTAPVLLIWGREDPVFPLGLAQRLQEQLGHGTRLEVIPEARHAPNLEYPALVSDLLVGFF